MILWAPDTGAGGSGGGGEGAPASDAGGTAAGTGAPGADQTKETLKDTLLTSPEEKPGGQEGDKKADPAADQTKDAQADLKPEKPEGYELAFAEGTQVDSGLLGQFQKTAHEAGLTKGQAQKVADLYAAHMADFPQEFEKSQIKAINDYIEKQNAELAKRPDFKAELTLAKKTLMEFGSDDLVDVFRRTAMGSHPAMFDFCVKVGKALSEPGFKGNSGGTQDETPRHIRIWGEDGLGPKQG
jgi:hypothetical protein